MCVLVNIEGDEFHLLHRCPRHPWSQKESTHLSPVQAYDVSIAMREAHVQHSLHLVNTWLNCFAYLKIARFPLRDPKKKEKKKTNNKKQTNKMSR